MRLVARAFSLLLGVGAAVMVLWSMPALADTVVDPATLHLGPGNCGAASITGCGGHPNIVSGGNLITIYQNSGGADPIIAPQLLILAVPNDPSINLFPTDPINSVVYKNTLSSGTPVTGSSAFAAAGTYGLKSPAIPMTGFFGDITSGSPQVYDFLGLQGPTDSSNTFGNFTTGCTGGCPPVDATATSFGIYVFALSGDTLDHNGAIFVGFDGVVPPPGTFAIAYGQTATVGGKKTIFDNAFTEADLLDLTTCTPPNCPTTLSVPEPSALPLTGLGTVGAALVAAFWTRRKDARERQEIGGTY